MLGNLPIFDHEKEQLRLSLKLHPFILKSIVSEGSGNEEGPANDDNELTTSHSYILDDVTEVNL